MLKVIGLNSWTHIHTLKCNEQWNNWKLNWNVDFSKYIICVSSFSRVWQRERVPGSRRGTWTQLQARADILADSITTLAFWNRLDGHPALTRPAAWRCVMLIVWFSAFIRLFGCSALQFLDIFPLFPQWDCELLHGLESVSRASMETGGD